AGRGRGRAVGSYLELPAHIEVARTEALPVVTGLVAQSRRDDDRTGGSIGGDVEDHADPDLVLVDGERKLVARQFEIDRWRIDDFHDVDTVRRRKGEGCRDEAGFSWRVRLDVQTIGHRHNEQGAQAGARRNGRLLCRGFVDVEDRRNLRRGAGGRDEQTEQQREWGRLRTE